MDAGQLNEVELENQTHKAILDDVQSRHKELAARYEQASKSATQQQAALSEQQVCHQSSLPASCAVLLYPAAQDWDGHCMQQTC